MSGMRGALLAPLLVLALAGCGDDGGNEAGNEEAAPAVTVPAREGATGTPSETRPPTEPSGPPPGGASAAVPPGAPAPAGGRPAPGSCVDIPEAPDGRYTVADAGTAVVTREGDRLVLGEVTPAEGWTHSVDDRDDDDEVEVEFRRGADELDLEVEIDDGRVEAEICADDD